MENLRNYMQRGSPDCPIEVYHTTRRRLQRPFIHRHPELEILFIEDGTTVHRLDGQTLTLHPNDILIIAPNTVHSLNAYTTVISTWSMVIVPEAITMPPTHIFQKQFVEPLQQGRLLMPTVLHPGEPAHSVLFPLLQQLQDCLIYTDNYKINRFSAAVAICTALSAFCRITDSQTPAPEQQHPAVRACMHYIQHNYSQRLTLVTLAEQVQMQPDYLCVLFKKHTGQTVVEYITQVRVAAAADLLRSTQLLVSHVAERCGFHSECLLYKNFKAIMGMTPNAYRKQQRRIPS